MKIAIVGGHLSPALSVIESLDVKDEVFYIGRKTNFEGDKGVTLEYQEIQSRKIPFFSIVAGRLQRKPTRYTLISLSKIPVGFIQTTKILKQIKPDLVLSFGGYLSIPVALSAKLLKIPIVIHEQTFEAGFANKLISRFADKVLISWESSRKFFPSKKTISTGIPLTKEIINIKSKTKVESSLPIIYMAGGSSGSHFINSLIFDNLSKLLNDFVIIHQTGDSKKYNDFDLAISSKNNLSDKFKDRYIVKRFLNHMESAQSINKADFYIGRAGINTVSELIFLQKPAIVIPLPFGQKNEQLKNANFIKELGLGEVLIQNEITNKIFLDKVLLFSKNLKKYGLKKQVLENNASEKIVKVIKDVYKEKTAKKR